MELFLTLVVGLFILFGSGFAFIFKNDKKFIDFSTSLGFGVMISLILFELIPEVIEIFSDNQNIVRTIALTIIFVAIGILILKILDLFIPDHDNKSTSNKLYHIALITSISLIITMSPFLILGSILLLAITSGLTLNTPSPNKTINIINKIIKIHPFIPTVLLSLLSRVLSSLLIK